MGNYNNKMKFLLALAVLLHLGQAMKLNTPSDKQSKEAVESKTKWMELGNCSNDTNSSTNPYAGWEIHLKVDLTNAHVATCRGNDT